MFIFTLTAAILSVFCLSFAVFLFFRRWTNVLAVYLALYIFVLGIWVGSNALADIAKTPFQNILWSGMAVISGALFTSLYLCFVYVYSHRRTPPLTNLISFFAPTAFFASTAFTKAMIAETLFPLNEPSQIVPGSYYPLLIVYIFGGLLYGSIQLGIYYRRRATPEEQTQIQYMEAGFLTTFCASGLFNVILPIFGENRFYSLGTQFSIVMIITSSYAILKHKLLDIKTVVQRGLVYVLVISLITICYSAVVTLVLTFAAGLTDQAYLIAVIVTTCLGILCFEPLKKYFIRLTDRTFYRNRMSHEVAVDVLSRAINENHDPGQMLFGIIEATYDVFRAESTSFSVLKQGIPSTEVNGSMTMTECNELLKECPAETNPPIELVVPLIFEDRITALLGLGSKKSGEPYYSDDLSLLTAFAYQAALSLNKSQRYYLAKRQMMRLQDQHAQDETTLALAAERVRQGVSEAHQALEMVADLKRRILVSPQEPVTTAIGDLSKLEDFLQPTGQAAAGFEVSNKAPSFNLSALAGRLAEHFTSLAERQGIRLKAELEPNLIVVGLSQPTEDTLVTTIGTALRHMDDRSELTVTLEQADGQARIRVVGEGYSMSIAELAPYFDQLRRSTYISETADAGLALTMTSQEIVLRDDTLGVRSVKDQTTEVYFVFDLVRTGK